MFSLVMNYWIGLDARWRATWLSHHNLVKTVILKPNSFKSWSIHTISQPSYGMISTFPSSSHTDCVIAWLFYHNLSISLFSSFQRKVMFPFQKNSLVDDFVRASCLLVLVLVCLFGRRFGVCWICEDWRAIKRYFHHGFKWSPNWLPL